MLTFNLALVAGIGVLVTLYLLRRRTRIITDHFRRGAGDETPETGQSPS